MHKIWKDGFDSGWKDAAYEFHTGELSGKLERGVDDITRDVQDFPEDAGSLYVDGYFIGYSSFFSEGEGAK